MNIKVIATIVTSMITLILVMMIGLPQYKVWQQKLAGKANLAKATQERLIQVEQAKAELESSKYRAQAIEVVGKMAQKYPEYRQQEFIGAFAEALKEGNISQILYIPTEAGIPITEAGRR